MIDFLRYRWLAYMVSFFIIGSFVVGALYRKVTYGYVFTYSVDFTGGTEVTLRFEQAVSGESVVKALKEAGIQDATPRELSPNEVMVRMHTVEKDMRGLGAHIKDVVEKAIPNNPVTISKMDAVGASVGKEMAWHWIYAVIIGLLAILLYLWFSLRHISFAIGNIVATVHDLCIILAFVFWFNYEISMSVVTAILIVLGYSVNDTIVIFFRIRENLVKMKGQALDVIVNTSLNATLRRTLLTSFATLLVVTSLMIFGGEVLRSLSFALFVGIVFGTYSSIFVASPAMMLLQKRHEA